MTRRDRLTFLALLVLLAVVGAAMLVPGAGAPGNPSASSLAPAVTYREAVVGRPSSIDPLTARTQADRDLVALLFRGLVREAPDGTIAPDLARNWNVSPDGKSLHLSLTYRQEPQIFLRNHKHNFSSNL